MADPRLDPANDDDPFDDRLRRELANLVPDPEPAAEVFNRLTPAFRRARRVQQVKHGTLAVTALALVLGGIGMASLMLGDEARLTVAGESELSRDVVRSDSGERLAVAGTTTTIEQADSRSESDSEGAPSESDSDDPDSDNSDSDSHDSDDQSSTSGNAADARRRGDATDDSKDRPSTDDDDSHNDGGGSAPSAPSVDRSDTVITGVHQAPDGTTIINSKCGSMAVRMDQSSVELVDLNPESGVQTQVKASGPKKIVVEFEGTGTYCKIQARVRNGQLEIDGDDEN